MSRRVLAVLSACCIAALTVTAVAVARGGDHDAASKAHKRAGHAQRTAGHPADVLASGLFASVTKSLAQRLDVEPRALRAAIKAVAAEQWQKRLAAAGLTPGEIAALKACRGGHARRATSASGCDAAAAKSAVAKLKAAAKAKPDLTALKTDLATSLAQKLGKTPDEVLAAVRAELESRLTQAVQAGWLTPKGHDLALACFDAPATCDLKALKGEVRLFGHHGRNRQGTPGPGPGKMTPGGRATSTPLRD
jgi:hypothetical protein